MEKKKIEFSKLVMIFISLVWVASLIGVFIKPEISFILDYTNGVFVSGVIGYLTKSGVENSVRFANVNNENKERD